MGIMGQKSTLNFLLFLKINNHEGESQGIYLKWCFV